MHRIFTPTKIFLLQSALNQSTPCAPRTAPSRRWCVPVNSAIHSVSRLENRFVRLGEFWPANGVVRSAAYMSRTAADEPLSRCSRSSPNLIPLIIVSTRGTRGGTHKGMGLPAAAAVQLAYNRGESANHLLGHKFSLQAPSANGMSRWGNGYVPGAKWAACCCVARSLRESLILMLLQSPFQPANPPRGRFPLLKIYEPTL